MVPIMDIQKPLSPRFGISNSTGSTSAISNDYNILNNSKPPEHLSEFFSFMNTRSPTQESPTHSDVSRDIPGEDRQPFSDRNVKRQPSLNTFTSFSPSVLDLPNIVTSKDFHHNVEVYSNLLQKAEKLRIQLLQVSNAANDFGQALEDCIDDCPKVNNSKVVRDGLINASGLQYMIGSNEQILSRLIESSFERPLRKELNDLKTDYEVNYSFYQQEIKAKSKVLRQKELENLKLSKQKTRNLNVYKSNLLNLTSQLDEIDRLKYDYYHEVNSMISKFNQDHLLIKTGSLVRAQLEIAEGIARKGWSGGGLDELLSVSPDLFETNDSDDTAFKGTNDTDNETGDGLLDKTIENNFLSDRAIAETEENNVIEDDDVGNDTLETVRAVTPDAKKNPVVARAGLSPNIVSQLKKPADSAEQSFDESFSLPIINKSNSLLHKLNEQESSPIPDESIQNNNILDELDE